MLQPEVREAVAAVMSSIDALTAVLARHDAALPAEHGLPADPGSRAAVVREAVAGLKALELAANAQHGRQAELLVRAAGQTPEVLNATLPQDETRDTRISDIRAIELAAALNCTPNRVRTLVAQARTLCGDLPHLLQAVHDGSMTAYQSRIAVEAWCDLTQRFAAADLVPDDQVAHKFQARLLIRAHHQTAAEFRRTARAAVSLLSPAAHAAAMDAAREERTVMMEPAANGMAYLTALLDVAQATRVMQVLAHCARTDTTLTGTQSQRMADALVSIVSGSTEVSAVARSHAAEIQIIVSLESLHRFAAAIAAGGVPDRNLAGQIAGTDVMVEGQGLLALMGDARFRRLVVDQQTGQLLDFGRETYRPPTHLRDHVRSRDRNCQAPGCVRPARYSDVDHVIPWEAGGMTSDQNLAALCRTHHVLKTHGDWRYTMSPHRGATWLTPNGLVIQRPPGGYAELLPDDDPPF